MESTLNPRALWDISYGLYVVTSVMDGRLNGQIVNTVFQVSAEPPRVAVSIHKSNLTHEYILKSGVMAISILAEQASMNLIGLFGFRSGREVDKFKETAHTLGVNGCPIVLDNVLSFMEGKVVGSADGGTHTVFLVELIRAEILNQGTPLTYAHYQAVKKGHASKNAPTYKGDLATPPTAVPGSYKCSKCGYVYDPGTGDATADVPPGTAFAALPEDWICPICGVGKAHFEAFKKV